MPWKLSRSAPGCKGWAVVKKDGGEVVGCHGENRTKAVKQLKALYSSYGKEQRAAK